MEDRNKIIETAKKLGADNKGILATDATEDTMNKRMGKAGISPTEELRCDFREILLTTSGFEEFVSGVILNDEIIRQKTSDGKSFPDLLKEKGVLTGIKVDKKAHDMANYPGEKIAEGLDGLRDRFIEYKGMGAEFAKFRAVITIGNQDVPSRVCIDSNAHTLARYAALAQEQGIVPIVEPEVLMDGEHDLERCAQVTTTTLRSVFYHLNEQKVDVEGIVLKPNMIVPGKDCATQVSDKEIAERTLDVLKKTVTEKLQTIVFLSGGMPAPSATARLNEMALIGGFPWQLSFSYERGLEGPAMEIWKGDSANKDKAQQEFLKRARLNSLARQGKYTPDMES